jgi:UDP-glucose 4-epimerase
LSLSYEEAYEEGFEDMMRRVPDTSRINEAIGWAPTRSLEDILADIVEYETTSLQA